MWRPSEIVVNRDILDDPITQHLIAQCPNIPVRHIGDSRSESIKAASTILTNAPDQMLPAIQAGKQVIHIAPVGSTTVDEFLIEDERMMCPAFDRLKFASNGCFYSCDWCFLKATYRAQQNYITVRVEYDKIKKQIHKRLSQTNKPVMFNTGELADSLAMEHLTKSVQEFVPYFAQTDNGYMYLLTKSTNIDAILDLEHNERTIVAWSLNADVISRRYEVGAPSLAERLNAARRVQDAGYPVRVRLDPILPVEGWQRIYAEAIEQIFAQLSPERITLGTLRFEKQFYNMRNTIFQDDNLKQIVGTMQGMLDKKGKSEGKYSFSDEQRIEMFRFAINEIRRHDENVAIALCKESVELWDKLGLSLSDLRCACVYGGENLEARDEVLEVRREAFDLESYLEGQELENRKLYTLPLQALSPDPEQPRKHIDETETDDLAQSIREHGVLQPILFRKDSEAGKLVIVSGERRYRASVKAEKTDIPAIYYAGDNVAEVALVENIQRQDLTPIEEAEALQRLQKEQKYSQSQLSSVIGKAVSTISEILSLNKLPEDIKSKCRESGAYSRRALVEVVKASTQEEMKTRFKKVAKGSMTSDQLRQDTRQPRSADAKILTALRALQTQLRDINLGALDAEKRNAVEDRLREVRQAINAKLT